MRRSLISALIAIAFTAAAIDQSSAQESYTYTETRTHTHTLKIDWLPEHKNYRRYTVSVSPLRVLSRGVKFDFETELPRPGHWLGTSLSMHFVPSYDGSDFDSGNGRSSILSSFGHYNRMWSVGTSAIYKYIFSRRGWYLSPGLTFDLFRVGVFVDTFTRYRAEDMTFYHLDRGLDTRTFFKPTARFVIGKHMALSRRCYFDLYGGLGLSYSFHDDDRDYNRDHDGFGNQNFDGVGGFGYRGLTPVGGFRFGVLLWKDIR